MRIPLDYYQVLGVPPVATMGQIQQAAADRNLQQPRHEYNAAAIESRRKLLNDAQEVLTHPTERPQYDALLMEAQIHFGGGPEGENPLANLELEPDRFLGGLLILAEIGEYEKLLSLAWPLLGDDEALRQAVGPSDLEESRQSLCLTMALALLELGREKWRQNLPAVGCEALETSLKLLRQQDIYPTVQSEVQRELYKFRPQYILSALAAPPSAQADPGDRQQALVMLQELIFTCANPQGYGVYGMTQDGFIAYIDQIRQHLTTHEQQNLFEEPATQSGNPIFTYLLVYAMVARGFYYQMPELVYRAQQLLTRHLGRQQDVFIEQALCSLLLGQTQEALQALERTNDRESLVYISRHSVGNDLLPGLCSYSELWFQTQVFPHFADLVHHRVSLHSYFDNPQVQAYLNDLPSPASGALEPEAPPYRLEVMPLGAAPVNLHLPLHATVSLPSYRSSVPIMSASGSPELTLPVNPGGVDLPSAQRTTPNQPSPTPDASRPANVVPFERPRRKGTTPEGDLLATSPSNPHLENLDRTAGGSLAAVNSKTLVHRTQKNTALARRRQRRQLISGLVGILGVLALVLGLMQLSKSKNALLTSLTGGSPGRSPTISPPQPLTGAAAGVGVKSTTTPGAPALAKTLTVAQAQTLVEKWLAAKTQALSPSYDTSALSAVLTEPALGRALTRSRQAKASSSHWQYQHQVQVQPWSVVSTKSPQQVEALVQESAQFYERDRPVRAQSYEKKLRLRYEMVNREGRWLIKAMTVIQ